jgi:Protein of unknown function (DUF2946)
VTRPGLRARWVGCFFACVILLGQMAPAISGLLWHPAQMEVEICSVDGQRSTVLIDLDTPAKPAATHGGHCPMCLAQNDTPGLIPDAGAAFSATLAYSPVLVATPAAAPAQHPVWPDAPARAPPALA